MDRVSQNVKMLLGVCLDRAQSRILTEWDIAWVPGGIRLAQSFAAGYVSWYLQTRKKTQAWGEDSDDPLLD